MDIYFDNAATTKTSLEAANKAFSIMTENYGNPSSMHLKGLEAENQIREVKQIISDILNCDKSEIYFTSGGTESNNTAILGTALGYKRSGKHIITTKIEHPAISEPFKILQDNGYEITYLNVNSDGYIDINSLKNSIRTDTILVSIIHINNEIGVIQNIELIGKIIKELNQNTLFHTDAVQSFGKYNIDVKSSKIDLLSISGHKFHAPKGIGVLYMHKNLKTKPLLFGGGQQNNFRPGTENVPSIAALGIAAKQAYQNLDYNYNYIKDLKTKLAQQILNIDGTNLNGNLQNDSPYILNISFKDIRAEVLLHALENEGISVSSGSACSAHKKQLSNTLKSINAINIEGAIRFSFSKYNTIEEVDFCTNVLNDLIPRLRRFK